MMTITREVRFSLVPLDQAAGPVTNSWAGWPTSGALVPHLALRATVSGPVDPRTGLLVNAALIDRVVRETAVTHLRRQLTERVHSPVQPAGVLAALWRATANPLQDLTLERLELRATPYLRYAITAGDLNMVTMTQSFEFAAAHRLYVPQLSDEENRRIFGKCASPNGHGHNYVLEVTIAGEPDPGSGALTDLAAFEAVVQKQVVDRLDHKHLNADCTEFADLNPTVENITLAIWNMLEGALSGVRLHRVRVWETPKTYAEYTGP